ncbi:hypothetical protein DXG01_000432 [Tephrocybe rancida]|nr:hypothetical protein DXG01_000432 [Tephrocybe rancida]
MVEVSLKERHRSDYVYFLPYRTRWSDNDQYSHINNSIYYHLFDSIVNTYLIDNCGLRPNKSPQIGLVVSSFCEFFAPLSFPQVLDLGLRVSKLGKSSVTYEVGVFEEGKDAPAAVGGYTHVFVDSETRKSTAMGIETKIGLEKLHTNTKHVICAAWITRDIIDCLRHIKSQHPNADISIPNDHGPLKGIPYSFPVSSLLLSTSSSTSIQTISSEKLMSVYTRSYMLSKLNPVQDKKSHFHGLTNANLNQVQHTYGARYSTNPIPKYRIASKGLDAASAYQLIHDELSLDGSPVLNLASFVHTWMPPEADKLFKENQSKNLIDTDEYPATQALHTRCISILADLWHAPSAKGAIGTATTGSSEAIQLGGLAMKKIWQAKRKAAGKSIHEPGPNIVMGANAQVALEKFARYFEVECRLVPVTVESHYRLDAKKAMEYVDENTIGIFVILGTQRHGTLGTYTGHYEPVKEISDLLDEYETKTGHYVPIHVDAASGGFVAPFATPKLIWDFKLPRVVSINSSGHKFGLSYVGVGWIIWRDKAHLPKELIFELHYLGSVEYSFSLNFSRPAAPIITQYFNLIHLGFEGYRAVALDDLKNARLLSRALENSKYYTVLSDIHRKIPTTLEAAKGAVGVNENDPEAYSPGLPVVSFRFSDAFQEKYPEVEQRWIQTLLRAKGWIVPNYELPPSLEQVQILRVVVKESMTEVLVDQFVADLMEITESLARPGSAAHGLNMLDRAQRKDSRAEQHVGALEKGSGEASSGTYARPC